MAIPKTERKHRTIGIDSSGTGYLKSKGNSIRYHRLHLGDRYSCYTDFFTKELHNMHRLIHFHDIALFDTYIFFLTSKNPFCGSRIKLVMQSKMHI